MNRAAWLRLWPVWLLPGVVVALNVVWLAGLRGQVVGRGSLLARQVRVLEQEVGELEAQRRRLEQDEKQLADLRAGLDALRGRDLLPMRERLVPFLTEVVKQMKEAGLAPERIGYSSGTDEKSGLVRFSASYSVTGSYEQIRKAVFLLESSPQLVVIDSIGLRGEAESASLAVQVQLVVTTFFSDSDDKVIQAVSGGEATGGD